MIERLEDVVGAPVSRETLQKLSVYVECLKDEAARQNLVSASTLANVWERHIIDSAQLVRFGQLNGSWVDIGAGAGLPGVVIACLVRGPVTLVEPRALRAEFLRTMVTTLGLNATVVQSRAEAVIGCFDIITGRAVALLSNFFAMCQHLSTEKTQWVLPKGRSAQEELEVARHTWQGLFHVERSATMADSAVVIASHVRRRVR